MSQSPELAGGEGFTYEGDAAALYLVALLAEANAPGIDDLAVAGVSVQQRDFGEPLDDVIVDFVGSNGQQARLSLQVKRSLTISSAATNKDFRDIIRDSWATLGKSDFRQHIDRYGAAVGAITAAKQRALTTLCEYARESLTTTHFDARFAPGGNAGGSVKAVKADVEALLNKAKGSQCTSEEVQRFLAHFVLIHLDFLREGATEPSEAINRIRNCLVPNDAEKAPLVWSRIVQLARASAGMAGQFNRPRLVRAIARVARLRGATSLHADLDKISALARSYAEQIQDDVGGTRLSRQTLLDELDAKLTSARLVQIRGLPGNGKSVLIRRAVQRAVESGPTLFLKADQLEGTSWVSYATSQGLSGAILEHFLVEIGATGTPVLFVDGIDRVEREHQPVVRDVIHAIVHSPLLADWRIVVSVRDTGIELLRNWLDDLLALIKVDTRDVGALSEEEAEQLAKAKPHLHPLLFGTSQVREIVRRPFFAKILNQSFTASSTGQAFTPQSEIDLIENWWMRGGYNASGQSAIERQRTLLNLANLRARNLSQPIKLSQLASVAHIDNLKADGILQDQRPGHSVRFAHDIFFEWAFINILIDKETEWLDEIKQCGEPPAVARTVELLSQLKYAERQDWTQYLRQTQASGMRSQWTRAWLLGPLGTATFESAPEQFAAAAFADNFRLLEKALVWFQAEKTVPNPSILVADLPQDQRQRYADALSWPSDFAAWRRLITFLLARIDEIPPRLFPEIVAVFEVWQNATWTFVNDVSHAILEKCADWLREMADRASRDEPDREPSRLAAISDLGDFRRSLAQLILKSCKAEPSFTAEYIDRVMKQDRIRDREFEEIAGFSTFLAESHPVQLVDLTLVHLREELPADQVARERVEQERAFAMRRAVLAKPESERTRRDELILSGGMSIRMIGDFSHHDWQELSVDRSARSFSPSSPLREPFHALFRSAPTEALRLFKELCNHAIMAWRQLHSFSRDRRGKPIPLELHFPWGSQKFWGNDREYLWSRSIWAPKPIASAFLSLEDWCFSELERGRPIDELIQQIVEGNECIGILGVVAALALAWDTVSEAVFPLVTSQVILTADQTRFREEFQWKTAGLIGFEAKDQTHIAAIRRLSERPGRQKLLRWLVPHYVFGGDQFSQRTCDALLSFKNALPFRYDEHRDLPEAREQLLAQALEYEELADPANYEGYRVSEDSGEVYISHVSPSASAPESQARAEQARLHLQEGNIWAWASKSFEEGAIADSFALPDALSLIRRVDSSTLFELSQTEEENIALRRGAVAATAALALKYPDQITHDDLAWAEDVLDRAIQTPEEHDVFWSSGSVIPWHPSIFVARGLAANLREGRVPQDGAAKLLALVAHPLEIVSLAALQEISKLWSSDSKLVWSAMVLAFSLCNVKRRGPDETRGPSDSVHKAEDAQAALDTAMQFYLAGEGWLTLPQPPPAWIKLEAGSKEGRRRSSRRYTADDRWGAEEEWGEPDTYWYSQYAAKIIPLVPVEGIFASDAKPHFLNFISSVLAWTNEKNAPSWADHNRRQDGASELYEWTNELGTTLGRLAGLLPLEEVKTSMLDPIVALDGDSGWSLLQPFASTYICRYIYDAAIVPSDAVAVLDLCLGRLLESSAFDRDSYRPGEFHGFDQPRLVRSLMFVEVEHAALAARYVNGDWSEIDRILPIVDRYVRAGGWAASVMSPFLTLCERAKATYPAETFADQVLSIISDGLQSLVGWRGTFIPARIAQLVQDLAGCEPRMPEGLARKLLGILDLLVDMGDRRGAALQLGEAFREIRL